ncbi:c-type cytochrome [Lysobacter cavernae]|uniref:C-type cytochrome n=1 Tax=Lysobacter cavernae TaxID=1685901 RepID=A0ABV7RKX4_9GAMM
MKTRPSKSTLLPSFLVGCAALAVGACQRDGAAPAAVATPITSTSASTSSSPADLVARGEYLIRIAGCNDCHTAGYAEAQGKTDKSQWLTGSPLGYKGPWGTTYAANLRQTLAAMDEAQWLDYSAKLRTRPIMPDFAVRAMSVEDRRALYHFIKSLGPGGGPAPGYLPPGQPPPAPYFELMLPGPPPATAAVPAAAMPGT